MCFRHLRVAWLLAVGLLFYGSALAQPFTTTVTVVDNQIHYGAEGTVYVTVTNNGSTDALNVAGRIYVPLVLNIVEAWAPWPWTATIGKFQGLPSVAFRGSRLGAGETVTIGTRISTVTSATPLWPGARLSLYFSIQGAGFSYYQSLFEFVAGTITAAGSGPAPTAPSRLVTASAPVPIFENVERGTIAFDPLNARFAMAAARRTISEGSLLLSLRTGDGAAVGALEFAASSYPSPPFDPQLTFSPEIGEGAGGFMLLWQQRTASDNQLHIFASPIITQTMTAGVPQAISDAAIDAHYPAVSYSRTSRVFLAAWLTCGATSATCRTKARRIDASGQPVGGVLDVAADPWVSRPAVLWNPVVNEFAVFSFDRMTRIGPDGAIRGWLAGRLGDDVAVNEQTGNYIIIGDRSGGMFAAEISPAGHTISRGLVAFQRTSWGSSGLSFNPVSGTFLYAGTELMVELNAHGVPLSQPRTSPGCTGGRIAALSDAAEWRALRRATTMTEVCSVGVGTSSIDGGSDARLGGCTTADPFVALGGGHCYDGAWVPRGVEPAGVFQPVVIEPAPAPVPTPVPLPLPIPIPVPAPTPSPVPSACATPDPFVALGGGVCVNGGWVPADHPLASGGGAPPPPPAGSCTTTRPGADWVCVNGGWVPPDHPLARGGGEPQ